MWVVLVKTSLKQHYTHYYYYYREASRYFRNKKREYLKDKINELANNSKNKNLVVP
jgi:transposase